MNTSCFETWLGLPAYIDRSFWSLPSIFRDDHRTRHGHIHGLLRHGSHRGILLRLEQKMENTIEREELGVSVLASMRERVDKKEEEQRECLHIHAT